MRPAVLLLAVALLVGACGDDSGNGVDGQTATTPSSAPTDSTGPDPDGVAGDPPEPLAVADPEAPPAGSARIVLGAVVDEVLTVDSCVLDGPSTPDGAVPVEPIAVTASAGTGAERIALDLRRFVQDAEARTITDTVGVAIGPADAPTSIWQAQRFEVDGLVTDARDPAADAPLVAVRSGSVEVRGVFAPPGNFAGDGGLLEGVVLVTCD